MRAALLREARDCPVEEEEVWEEEDVNLPGGVEHSNSAAAPLQSSGASHSCLRPLRRCLTGPLSMAVLMSGMAICCDE